MDKKTNISFTVLVILCIIILCISLAPKTLQNDTFYTIKMGEHIVKEGLTEIDQFTWHEDVPYTYPHWLYDVMIYKIYDIGGHAGIYISTIVLSCILGIIVYITNAKITKNKLVAFILTLGVMYLLQDFIAARAQLVTFILFTLEILFIEMFLEKKKIGYGIGLIAIAIFITDLHAAVWPFFFVLALPYIGEYIIAIIIDFIKKLTNKEKIEFNKLDIKRSPMVKWLIIILIICAATGLITKWGDNPYTHLSKIMSGDSTKYISEHQPLALINQKEFLVAVTILLAFLIFTNLKIKLRDFLMITGLLILALMTRRQMSMFILIASPVLGQFIAMLFDKYEPNGTKEFIRLMTTIYGKIITVSIVLIMSILLIRPTIKAQYVSTHNYPVEAAKYILENLDVENMRLYNEYNYGSYLLMNDIKVFIDSRADLYTKEFNGRDNDIFVDAMNTSQIGIYYEDMFTKYNVTHVILFRTSKLNMFLSRNNKYNELYKDDRFVIYERLKDGE